MMFMNTWEIDDAVRTFADEPVLGAAARTLANLRDAADENSDGWAYWPKPCRAAAKLQGLLEAAVTNQYRQDRSYVSPTAADLRKALSPVKAFRTRSGLDFEIEEA
jgi:hypothetical protein